ncbi:MAG: HAD family hydrolase [Bacillota bacterium]
MKYDTIVWDFDGVVADTAPDIIQSARMIIDMVGSTPKSDDFIAKSIGGGARKLLQRVLDPEFHDRLDSELLPVFVKYYNENCDVYTALYPGVLETLQRAKEIGIKMGLATMKVRKATLKICDTLGVSQYFDTVVTPEDVEKPKPDPESIFKILDAVGSTPDKAVLIGDTKTDILTAQNSKMDCAVVPYGYGNFEDMKRANPTYIIENVREIIDIILYK